jgi:hypothetical protein
MSQDNPFVLYANTQTSSALRNSAVVVGSLLGATFLGGGGDAFQMKSTPMHNISHQQFVSSTEVQPPNMSSLLMINHVDQSTLNPHQHFQQLKILDTIKSKKR